MRVGSLFSGIGGLDLGLERAGMEIVWQVEIDEWCRRVLAKHWPDVPKFEDVRDLTGEELEAVDLICGGFPCQPVSVAGQRKGADDSRWLWPEMARLVRVLRPRFVLVENVPGLFHRGFGDVLGDLAESGYDTEWESLPAAAIGAPHLRDRIFVVAHTQPNVLRVESEPESESRRAPIAGDNGQDRILAYADRSRRRGRQDDEGQGSSERVRPESGSQAMADPKSQRERSELQGEGVELVGAEPRGDAKQCGTPLADAAGTGPTHLCEGEARSQFARRDAPTRSGWWDAEPDVGRVAHGVPSRVDRLRGLGNAVVPQVAEAIGQWIIQCEQAPQKSPRQQLPEGTR